MHAFLLASQPSGLPGEATGTPGAASTAAPATTTTAGTQAADPGPAPPGGCMGLGQNGMLLMFALPLLLMFMMSRSQNKKQKELESGLKVGDRVIMKTGIIGKLTEVGDTRIKLEIAPGVTAQFLKTAIDGLDTGDPKKKDDAKDAKKDDAKDAKKDDAKDAKKDDPKKDAEDKKDAKKDDKSK